MRSPPTSGALKVSPDDKAILLNLGLVYLRQEAHSQALPLFERIVAIDPQHLQARQLLAVCRAYAGQLAPAIRDLESLRAAAPRDEGILFLLGFAYLKNHDPESAKTIFEHDVRGGRPRARAVPARQGLLRSHAVPPGRGKLPRSAPAHPAFPGVRLELGKVYISLRRTDEAIRELELALKDSPGDGDASYFLGGLLAQEEPAIRKPSRTSSGRRR